MRDPLCAVYESYYTSTTKSQVTAILEGCFCENSVLRRPVCALHNPGADGRIARRRLRTARADHDLDEYGGNSRGKIIGKTPEAEAAGSRDILAVLAGELDVDELDAFGDAVAFKGVASCPCASRCAALAWWAAFALILSKAQEIPNLKSNRVRFPLRILIITRACMAQTLFERDK
jgi:hypothetical protein